MMDVDKRLTSRLGQLACPPGDAAPPEDDRTRPCAGILPFDWGVHPRFSTNGLPSHAAIPSTLQAPAGHGALLRSRS